MIFESGSINSLLEKMRYLLDHKDEIKRMLNGGLLYDTVNVTWNPQVKANRLVKLCEKFLSGDTAYCFDEGPLSIARPVNTEYVEESD